MMFANNKVRERLWGVADCMWRSPLIWFSSGCSGDQIVPVSAVFYEIEEALAWAARHPGDMVHFPNGNQLQCQFAVGGGAAKRFRECAQWEEPVAC